MRKPELRRALVIGVMVAALPPLAAAQQPRPQQRTRESVEAKAQPTRSRLVIVDAPEALAWRPGPPSLPPGSEVAIVEGDPSKNGPFTIRLRLPADYRIPPHWHPAIEHITVIDGTFAIGMGERFDPNALTRIETGGYVVLPPGHRHFATSLGESVVQLHGIGPWQINYVDPADDPRMQGVGGTGEPGGSR